MGYAFRLDDLRPRAKALRQLQLDISIVYCYNDLNRVYIEAVRPKITCHRLRKIQLAPLPIHKKTKKKHRYQIG